MKIIWTRSTCSYMASSAYTILIRFIAMEILWYCRHIHQFDAFIYLSQITQYTEANNCSEYGYINFMGRERNDIIKIAIKLELLPAYWNPYLNHIKKKPIYKWYSAIFIDTNRWNAINSSSKFGFRSFIFGMQLLIR